MLSTVEALKRRAWLEGNCVIFSGASQRLGASALPPSQSGETGQLAVTNIRILTSYPTLILPFYYIMASF